MPKRVQWSRQELLAAFHLYCRLPFGKLHARNPDVKALSEATARTPSAVAMKACNFASLDNHHKQRGVAGLSNASNADRALWSEFQEDPSTIAALACEATASFLQLSPKDPETQATESVASRKVRLGQTFFRETVLASYESQCALTGVSEPRLLVASHIIPWFVSSTRRVDPRNGICLNALHDRAFDRGLITFDSEWKLVVSNQLRSKTASGDLHDQFAMIEGKRIRLPDRFLPCPDAMQHHRTQIFIN